jgi:hypothetical protein
MPDAHDQHKQSRVLDSTNDPVISYAILPRISEPRPVQGFADAAGILQPGDAHEEEPHDAPRDLAIQLLNVL